MITEIIPEEWTWSISEIEQIVRKNVKLNQSDWFQVDKRTFLSRPGTCIIATRLSGCDMLLCDGCPESMSEFNLVFSGRNEKFFLVDEVCVKELNAIDAIELAIGSYFPNCVRYNSIRGLWELS